MLPVDVSITGTGNSLGRTDEAGNSQERSWEAHTIIFDLAWEDVTVSKHRFSKRRAIGRESMRFYPSVSFYLCYKKPMTYYSIAA